MIASLRPLQLDSSPYGNELYSSAGEFIQIQPVVDFFGVRLYRCSGVDRGS
jgi:hypothetical protein